MKMENDEKNEGLSFTGPMVDNQPEEFQTTPTTESPLPYKKGDEVPIM